MAAGERSRWSHRFVLASAGFLVVWRAGALAGVPRRTEVVLGLLGFVLHTVFGMGYLLIPSYFERVLRTPRAVAVHLALAVSGTGLLAAASVRAGPAILRPVGASAWAAGVGVFLGSIAWTVRDNPLGRDTGTGDHRASRRPVDRFANLHVPVALGYLAVGSYELLASATALPGLTDGYLPRIAHLLAAGFAALLVFSLGFRLVPRFLDVAPPWPLVAVVLPAGALGPALLAWHMGGGRGFVVGAVAQATAVLGFAATYGFQFARTDRRRVGFVGVLAGVVSGAAAVALGLHAALVARTATPLYAHVQLALLGFLGLTIVGFAVQFFPPSTGRFVGASDRGALAVLGLLATGLAAIAIGTVASAQPVVALGNGLALVGALGYAYLVGRLLVAVDRRRS